MVDLAVIFQSMNRGQSTLCIGGYCMLLYSFCMLLQFARFANMFPGLIRVKDDVVRPGTPKTGHICGIAAGQPRSGPWWYATVDMLSRACYSRAWNMLRDIDSISTHCSHLFATFWDISRLFHIVPDFGYSSQRCWPGLLPKHSAEEEIDRPAYVES